MENIDDFMRQKFNSDDSGERFEFKEEFWEQAKALLEEEENKRCCWQWLFIGLGVAMALLALLLLGRYPGLFAPPKTGVWKSISLIEKNEKQTKPESLLYTVELGKKNDFASNRQSFDTLLQGNHTSRQGESGRKDSENSEKKSNLSSVKKIQSTRIKSLLDPVYSPTNQDTQKKDAATQGDIQEKEKSGPIATLLISNIPTPLVPFLLSIRVFVPKKWPENTKKPIANNPQPIEGNRFSCRLSVAGAAYPKIDSAAKWAGWAIGVFGAYTLNKNWSLQLGSQWCFMPGQGEQADTLNPTFVDQLHYSFGYKSEHWQRTTRGLHYLDIPLSVRWHKDRWGVEAGGSVRLLWAVQDRTEYIVSSSLEPAKTIVEKYIKGDSKPYNQTVFSVFSGAEFCLNDRFSVTTQGRFQVTPVFKTTSEGLKNKGLGNLELGLRFRLF
jgi:hypothetical protein